MTIVCRTAINNSLTSIGLFVANPSKFWVAYCSGADCVGIPTKGYTK